MNSIDEQLKPLNDAIDKMRALQADSQPGMFTWQQFMRENLLTIQKEAKKLTN